MAKKFENKVAFITGASSGIGAEVARQLVAQGARVALVARRAERLKDLASELGDSALAIEADVNVEADLVRAVQATRQKFGALDLVLANAGFGVVGNFEYLSVEDYRRQFETNVFAVLQTVKATLEDLKKSRGCLGLLGSVNGFVALPGSSPYGMSKYAVRSLAASLYHELAPYGICVTHIAPGFVDSEIRKVNNQGQFQEGPPDPMPAWIRVPTPKAAREILRALSRRRREVVVTTHGKIIVFVVSHFRWLVPLLISSVGIRGRKQPSSPS